MYQAFISAVNDKGGINGRKIVPDFKTYCPLTPTSELSVQICTAFTDDDKVFAVIGNVGDAGQDDAIITCLAKKHQTPVDDLRADAGAHEIVATGHGGLPGDHAGAQGHRAVQAARPAGNAQGQEGRRPRAGLDRNPR